MAVDVRQRKERAAMTTDVEWLETRQLARSAEAVKVARHTTIYLGECAPCARPVRRELEADQGPRTIVACVDCGGNVVAERLSAVTTTLVCDGSCMSARRRVCSCGCGGVNHGNVWGLKLGTSEVLDSALARYRKEKAERERKREQRREAERKRAQREADAQREANAGVFAWLRTIDRASEPSQFVADMALKASHGELLSERMLEVCERAMADRAERSRRDAEREAERAAAKPVPVGKGMEITGEIVSTRAEDNQFGPGGTYKMLVKHPDGWKVWGAIPLTLRSACGYHLDELRGRAVRFVADVQASRDDATFGYVSRPRKAELISQS